MPNPHPHPIPPDKRGHRPSLSPGEPSLTLAWLRVQRSLWIALRRIPRPIIREALMRLVIDQEPWWHPDE